MAQKRFRNFGLIRTNNLADVADPQESLTNLVNDLVTGDVEFTAEDLKPIQGLGNENVTPGDFTRIAGITQQQSVLNEDNEVILATAFPFVTIKNRIDRIIKTTDNPPFFNGGDGLKAEFWGENKVQENLTASSDGDDIFIGEPEVVVSPFWDNGFFEFSGNLDDTLAGSNGGIQWSGFYIPNFTGTTDFSFRTSGLFILEVENLAGDLEVVKSIYDTQITLTAVNEVNNSQVIEISQADAKFVAEGAFFNPNTENGIEVDSVEQDFDTQTFTIELTAPVSLSAGESFVLSIDPLLGSESFTIFYSYRNLEAFVPKKIRITLWYPGEERFLLKFLESRFRINDGSLSSLQFFNLYTEVNLDPDDDNFKDFFDNRLLVSGGTIGPESVTTSAEYLSVKTISPLNIDYSIPETQQDVTIAQYTYERNIDSNILSTTSTSPLTSNLEIGNIIIGEGIPLGTAIREISNNNVVVMNQDATSSGNDEIVFINHRGLVKVAQATSTGSVVTISDTDNLKQGMVVITSSNSGFIRISSIISSTEFETDVDLNLTGEEVIFVYVDKGIENRSLENFCIGVLGKETVGSGTVVNQGDFDIPLEDVNDLAIDMVVQSTGFIAEGTVITAIDTTNNIITVSNSVLEDMISGITIVFSPAGTTLNKEQCVIPLNTAPPFEGTPTGLTTQGNVLLSNNQSTLNVVELIVNDSTVTELTTDEPAFDKKIEIKINGTPFSLLGLSV